MSSVRSNEQRPCTEEKKRLRKAEERQVLCGQKLRIAQAAAEHWERQRMQVRSKLQRCQDIAEADVTLALNKLRDQIETLRIYAGLRGSSTSRRQ